MKYEYKIQRTDSPTASERQLTDEFGSQGWQLVQIYEWSGSWYYVFMRPASH